MRTRIEVMADVIEVELLALYKQLKSDYRPISPVFNIVDWTNRIVNAIEDAEMEEQRKYDESHVSTTPREDDTGN